MKKIYLFILPIFIFISCLYFLDLKSFAYDQDYNYPTAGVTVYCEWDNSNNNVVNKREFESIYPLVFYKTGDGVARIATPLQYGRIRSYTSSFQTDFGNWSTMSWQKINDDPIVYAGETIIYSGSGITFSSSNCIIFKDLQSVIDYFEDPESVDNLENVENAEGEEILQGSLSPSINWGDNDPNDVDNPWRPDTENIPAPQFEVVYDENGNVTNQIRFNNYIYNYSAGHGEDRIYGLRMTIMWNTYGSFLFDHTGGLLSQEYKVTYSDLLVGDIDTVFAFPEKENQIVRCPQTFNFNTNQAVIDSFNDLLETYDVNERTYNTNFSVSNDLTLTNKFKSFLERITCPYNTITFSVQYYRRMSDGTFHYGPWSTGKFTAPQQGAVFNANGVTLSGVGGMVQGNGGGLSGTDESGNWNNNWGNNTSDNLFNMSDLELDKVKANMTGLFSFFGEMPSFIQQCFLFLPDWVIAFIIACIVLVCAIGALKLALG